MHTILISGFEAFHTHTYNVTEILVNWLSVQQPKDVAIRTVILPVVRWKSIQTLNTAIQRHSPSAVIALGQSRRSVVSLERMAINSDHFKIPDNAGNQPLNAMINANGPKSLESTLPLKALLNALHQAGIPSEISDSAGTYVCNHLFYGLMETLHATGVPAGFIHLPSSQVKTSEAYRRSVDCEQLQNALMTIIDALTQGLSP